MVEKIQDWLFQKELFFIVLILFLGLYSGRQFLSGFVPTHDGEYHIIRLWQFDKMLKAGYFFPRWAPDLNNGYGVPLFSFFYPLPNYIGELFHLLGFSFVNAVQLTLASGLLVSALTFYIWLRCFFGKWQAASGSIFYLLAPYHLVTVFIRGSVGEVWALAIAPLVLFLTTKIIKTNKNRFYEFLLPIAIALLLLSHNILGFIFYGLSLIYGLLLVVLSRKKYIFLLCRYGLGFLLTSFFWVPAIIESKYVTGIKIINPFDHFASFFQLIIPSWGSGFSVPGVSDQLSFQIGIPHLLTFLLAVILAIRKRNGIALLFITISIISLVMMLDMSNPIWHIFPMLVFFQFPWRLLSVVIIATSFLAGYVSCIKPQISIPLFILSALLFYLPYTNAVVYPKREDSFYLSNPNWTQGTATLGNTFNTMWFTSGFTKLDKKASIVVGEGEILSQSFELTSYSLRINAKTPLQLSLHSAYFPGWNAKINGEKLQVGEQKGIIMLTIPKGEHSIMVSFSDTVVRKLSNMISVVFLLYVVYYFSKS